MEIVKTEGMKNETLTPTLKLSIIERNDCEGIHALRTNADVTKFITRDLNGSILEMDHLIEKRLLKLINLGIIIY